MRVHTLTIAAAVSVAVCANPVHAQTSQQQTQAPPATSAEVKPVSQKATDTKIKIAAATPQSKEPADDAPVTQAKQASKPPAKPKAKAKAKKKPAGPRLSAHINLSNQTMTVKVGGVTKHVMKISSGKKGFRTPTGNYRPQWMTKMHYSKKYDNAPMPHSVFYSGGFAIHATYATGRLGAPASHGCIRLSPSNAKKFYYLVQRYGKSSTRISIRGVAPKGRVYAKKKRKYRQKKYAYTTYGMTSYGYKPKKKVYAKPYQPAKYKVRRKAHKKPYTASYAPSTFTWPGD